MLFLVLHLALLVASAPAVAVDSTAMRAAGPANDTIGADVHGVADSLRCRIEPFCPHVWPNTTVRFRVRVANRSRRAIFLVRPPAIGSAREAPRVISRVTGPPAPAVAAWDGVAHLPARAMKASDFIPIPAGKEVDLFGRDGYVDPSGSWSEPGRYTMQFTYSTEESNPRPWLGTFQPDSFDGDWRPRFRRVPRVELHAECEFVVQQP